MLTRYLNAALTGLIVALGFAIAAMGAPAMAQSTSKSSVKAAIVYNIVRFARFPANRKQHNLCVLSSDPVGPNLRALDGRSAGGGQINVVTVSSPAKMGAGCHIIYMDSGSPNAVNSSGRGQLLIGSGPSFAEKGGTVGLIQFGGQIRFVINDRAARSSGTSFSAQLMQLAAKVIS